MRTPIITFALYLSAAGLVLAQDRTSDLFALLPPKATNAPSDCVTVPAPTPTRSIAPEDIEQDSLEFFQIYTPSATTNNFVIRFRYTEEGAKKMLAFRREHAGHEVVTQIGDFVRRGTVSSLSLRPGWTEEGWLKRRTDKFFGVSEDDARKIVEGLKKK